MCDPVVIIHDMVDLGRSPAGGRALWVRDRWKYHPGCRVYLVKGRKRERERGKKGRKKRDRSCLFR